MKHKRILVWLIALSMVFGLTLVTSFANEATTEPVADPLEYEEPDEEPVEKTVESEEQVEELTENSEAAEASELRATAATPPTQMWIAPSETNHIWAQIDAFQVSKSGTTNPTYTCQLFLPGDAVLEDCFLSWDGDMEVTVDEETYPSGECPLPTISETYNQHVTTYTFKNGTSTVATFKVSAYKGSAKVQRVFIDIDESQGTIAAMDGDADHKAECVGRININGTWYDMPKMKGRGNASWEESKDKKPYNINITTTAGKKINFPGIDSAKTKKWSFLAEVLDHSLLCNRSGYYLAYQMGIGQDTTSADVWMNGEYQGCYTVTPKTDSFVTDDGYIIEQDNYKEDPVAQGGDPQFTLTGLEESYGWSSCYNRITVKKMGDNLLLKDGAVDESAENMDSVAQNTIKPWLQEALDAIKATNGINSEGKHYTDYIDIESFAEMYLMHDYVKSYDVCAGSILFHRDGMTDGDKLYAGPIWDLDNAMGSVYQNSSLGKADDRRNGDRRSGQGEFISLINLNTIYKTSIYAELGKHDDFMAEVYKQYNKHRSKFDSLASDTQQMIDDIEASARMNHIKVTDLGNAVGKNNHYYKDTTTLGSGNYQQSYLATTNSKTDWGNYAANLKTYITIRSAWFANKYYDPDYVCGHDYKAVVTPPTCTAEGFTTYTCKLCGDSYVGEEKTPKIPHDYQDGFCTACGEKLLNVDISCSDGASVKVYKTQNLEGEFEENATSANPRNGETGLIDCSGEGQINFAVNLRTGYKLTGLTAEPTEAYKNLKLEDEETNIYRITKVKGDFTITVAAECAHSDLTRHDAAAATCTEPGNNAYWACDNCGKYFSDAEGKEEIEENSWVIPATGHTEVEISAVAPTCTEPGLTAGKKCSVCGEILAKQEELPPAHKWNSTYTVDKIATETTQGQKSIHCSVCDAIQEGSAVAIPKLQPTNQRAADGTAVGAGASYAVAEQAILTSSSDEGPEGTKYGVLKLKTNKQTKTSVTLNWNTVSNATKYVLYGNKCGSTNKMRKLTTLTGTTTIVSSIAGQNVTKGTYYKFIIVATDKNNIVVSTSKTIHVGTKGGKAGNYKRIKIKKSVLTKAKKLKPGKSLKLKAKAVKASGPKAKKHRGISYESTNPNIATVSPKGVVKAKAKGTCYVYAYTQNGVYKSVKVVVK